MVIKSLVLYQYLKDVVAFDTTLLIRVRFTVRKRVWVYLCILCDQKSLSAACYHLGLPSSSSIKVFSYFYLHKQESIPSYNKLICTSIERKPNKTKKQQKTSNKKQPETKKQPKEIVFSTITHFWHLLQTFSSHSEIFLLLILLTVNGFDYSLFMFYFFTQSSAVVKRKRWI